MADRGSSRNTFTEARMLRGSRFGLLCAFEYSPRSFGKWRNTSEDFTWSDETSSLTAPLLDFQIAERFLLSKQLFFGRRQPIPSYPPIRGVARKPFRLAIKLSKRRLDLDCEAIVSFFAVQNILTVLVHTEFAEITIDELIFLKEAKWYVSDGQDLWMALETEGQTEKALPIRSYQLALNHILGKVGAEGVTNYDWPIFDFIELHDSGPSVGRGPNSDNPLTLNEHWGLLCGDEGFRLIDHNESAYRNYLVDDANRFRGRDVFLYNFFHNSCLAFKSKDEKLMRAAWRKFYVDNVGHVPRLDRYLGFATKIPCLTDGIPLLVELCLLRYIELCRVDLILQSEEKKSILRFLWSRVKGMTPVEHAVSLLHRLDLYQESSLWIIGGSYTAQLFDYARIRARIDRTIAQSESAGADIRVFYIGCFSVFVAVVAAVAAIIALVK